MRSITMRYEYSGPEDEWRAVVGAFIETIDADADVAGKLTCQVAVADDGKSRIHLGRWSSQETLRTMQLREYFARFSDGLRRLIGGQPSNTSTEVVMKTTGW